MRNDMWASISSQARQYQHVCSTRDTHVVDQSPQVSLWPSPEISRNLPPGGGNIFGRLKLRWIWRVLPTWSPKFQQGKRSANSSRRATPLTSSLGTCRFWTECGHTGQVWSICLVTPFVQRSLWKSKTCTTSWPAAWFWDRVVCTKCSLSVFKISKIFALTLQTSCEMRAITSSSGRPRSAVRRSDRPCVPNVSRAHVCPHRVSGAPRVSCQPPCSPASLVPSRGRQVCWRSTCSRESLVCTLLWRISTRSEGQLSEIIKARKPKAQTTTATTMTTIATTQTRTRTIMYTQKKMSFIHIYMHTSYVLPSTLYHLLSIIYIQRFTFAIKFGTTHHITSHHITSHHITSHHITSHHIRSYDVASRCIALHCIAVEYATPRIFTSRYVITYWEK